MELSGGVCHCYIIIQPLFLPQTASSAALQSLVQNTLGLNLLLADLPHWSLFSEEQSPEHRGGFLICKPDHVASFPTILCSLPITYRRGPRDSISCCASHACLPFWGRRGEGLESADSHDINISSIVHSSCQWFNYQLTKLLAV